ncbi:DUF2971 domain-containing protein [Sphingomonas hylomeconis]|uniref:DUF2971 domain-containing protein n=1 Tax=Sphingomonas hylomeconis TaxID=1395958 RepID=A0ABV7SW05_9SPHN|nr:DUF2971 domain-containing protein [Sphingomonas hylomeconis]
MRSISGYFDTEANRWISLARNLPRSDDRFISYSSNGSIRDNYRRAASFIATAVSDGGIRTGPLIYHYTQLETFKNIVRGGELWASHHAIMNDFNEIVFAWDLLAIQISQKLAERGLSTTYEFLQRAKQIMLEDVNYYIVSFSQICSILSQWRAYAKPVGVSVGIPIALFAPRKQKSLNINLSPVLYGRDEHIQILEPIASDVADIFASWTEIDDRSIPHRFLQSKAKFTAVAPILKHSGFEEELEVRLFSDGVGYEKFQRPDGRGEFIKIDLLELFERAPFVDVIFADICVSPTRTPDEDVMRIHKFMQSTPHRYKIIFESQIPLVY